MALLVYTVWSGGAAPIDPTADLADRFRVIERNVGDAGRPAT
jgi:hypothetical protein